MLYDYFTKSAFGPAEIAILGAPAAAATVGALSSALSGGDWKDNLLNTTGAGAGAAAGSLAGVLGVTPGMEAAHTERLRSDLAGQLKKWRRQLKNYASTGEGLEADRIAKNIKTGLDYAPKKKLPSNSNVLKLGRLFAKHPALGFGALAGLGGGLGYTASNALTGREERPVRDVLIDYLKK